MNSLSAAGKSEPITPTMLIGAKKLAATEK
jgi:hypothetical protein